VVALRVLAGSDSVSDGRGGTVEQDDRPAREASSCAAVLPAGPAPITTTSH